MALADLKAALSQAGNLSQLKGLSAAYSVLLGGIPSLDGYDFLIRNNNATNFGAGPGPVFNDENIIINTLNALYQGNPIAKAAFNGIVGGGPAGADVLTAVYNYVIPASFRSAEGLAYFKSQEAFYTARAAELGIPGAAGAAVVAFAALTKIAVDNKIGGLGDSLNDLISSINNGTAAIPQNATTFTDLEVADGTEFDTNDTPTSTMPPVYSIAVNPSSVVEGNVAPGRTITFTVFRDGDVSKAGSVGLTYLGTADIGVDFDLSPAGSTVSFAPGASTATFTATVKPDTEAEPNETITFLLSNPTGGTLSILRSATATITNDDTAAAGPVYSIAVSPSSVIEGNTGPGAAITYNVTRTGDISKAGAVGLTYLGTATNGVDYDLSTTTSIVSFAAGASTATLTATVRPDTQVEPNETITVLIDSVGGGGTIGTANSATATITNDDTAAVGPAYAISVGPSSVAEGNSGPGNAITFTVTRTGDVSQPGSVAVALSGTADGSDYTSDLVGGVVSFNAGHNQVTFTVTTTPDATVEPDETVIATLGAITGVGTLGATTSATATITNDDTANTTTVNLAPGGNPTVLLQPLGDVDYIIVTGFSIASNKFSSVSFDRIINMAVSHTPGDVIKTAGQTMSSPPALSIIEIESTIISDIDYLLVGDNEAVERALGSALGSNWASPTKNTAILYVQNVGAAIYQFDVQVRSRDVDITPLEIINVDLIGVIKDISPNSLTSANYVS